MSQEAEHLRAQLREAEREIAKLNDTLAVAIMALDKAAGQMGASAVEDSDLHPIKLASRCIARFLAAQQPRTAEELRTALALLTRSCAEMDKNAEGAMERFNNIKNHLDPEARG